MPAGAGKARHERRESHICSDAIFYRHLIPIQGFRLSTAQLYFNVRCSDIRKNSILKNESELFFSGTMSSASKYHYMYHFVSLSLFY